MNVMSTSNDQEVESISDVLIVSLHVLHVRLHQLLNLTIMKSEIYEDYISFIPLHTIPSIIF
jgi:DNA-binding MltR family transcriptional regulator